MRTYAEIIEAMLELQDRITRVKVGNPDYENNEYYLCLNNRLKALKFVVGAESVIA